MDNMIRTSSERSSLDDQMGPGPQIDQRDAGLPEPLPQPLVVGEGVGVESQRKLYDRGIPVGLGLYYLVLPRQLEGGVGVLVIEMLQFPYQRAGDDETDVPEHLLHRVIEIDTQLKRHE